MPKNQTLQDYAQLDEAFDQPQVAEYLREVSSTSFDAATSLWRVVMHNTHLSARMKELILIALNASAASVNAIAVDRHVKRALAVGASPEDIVDVLCSIIGLANHSMYFALPILLNELHAAGMDAQAELPDERDDIAEIRRDFLESRGFWNERRESTSRLLPDYFKALSAVSVAPWKQGSLSPKEREFVYIAIDCAVNHQYADGLGMHIRHALTYGANRDEILAVFQLAALMGMEGFIAGAEALVNTVQHLQPQNQSLR